jgi:hypothetical protein
MGHTGEVVTGQRPSSFLPGAFFVFKDREAMGPGDDK